MNAANLIYGGMIEPTDDAAASMPPAITFENPGQSINGMVNTPVDNTFTTDPL